MRDHFPKHHLNHPCQCCMRSVIRARFAERPNKCRKLCNRELSALFGPMCFFFSKFWAGEGCRNYSEIVRKPQNMALLK
jgi:hypothetical protein